MIVDDNGMEPYKVTSSLERMPYRWVYVFDEIYYVDTRTQYEELSSEAYIIQWVIRKIKQKHCL